MFLLLACVHPELEGAAAAPALSPATFEALAAEELGDLPGRASAEVAGTLRWSDGGPVAAEGDGDLYGEFVVAEADGGVRLAVERSGVRLLPWVDRADLRITLAESTWIAGSGHAAPEGGAGVRFVGGAYVHSDEAGEFLEETGRILRVRVPVSEGLLDEVFVPTWYVPPPLVEGRVRWVGPEVSLLDDDGLVLGQTGREPWQVEEVRREGQEVLVEGTTGGFCGDPGVPVRAWVPAEQVLTEPPEFGFGWGCCCCGGFGMWGWGSSGPEVELRPDQLLYDAPEGSVVGVVTDATTRPVDREAGELEGWVPFVEHTEWGAVTVWVEPAGATLPDLSPPEGEAAASHDVAFEAERLDAALREAAAEAGLDLLPN